MNTVENARFGRESVVVDGKRFVRCEFAGSTLVFRGGVAPEFEDCSGEGTWALEGEGQRLWRLFQSFGAPLEVSRESVLPQLVAAVCQTCGYTSLVTNPFEVGPMARSVTLLRNAVPCPRAGCAGYALIDDQFVDDEGRVFVQAASTMLEKADPEPAALDELKALLADARPETYTPDALQSLVASIVPQAGAFLAAFTTQARKFWRAVAGLAVAVAIFLANRPSKAYSPDQSAAAAQAPPSAGPAAQPRPPTSPPTMSSGAPISEHDNREAIALATIENLQSLLDTLALVPPSELEEATKRVEAISSVYQMEAQVDQARARRDIDQLVRSYPWLGPVFTLAKAGYGDNITGVFTVVFAIVGALATAARVLRRLSQTPAMQVLREALAADDPQGHQRSENQTPPPPPLPPKRGPRR